MPFDQLFLGRVPLLKSTTLKVVLTSLLADLDMLKDPLKRASFGFLSSLKHRSLAGSGSRWKLRGLVLASFRLVIHEKSQ